MKRSYQLLLGLFVLTVSMTMKAQVPLCTTGCSCICNFSIINGNYTGTFDVGDPIIFDFIGSGCPSDNIDFGDGCGQFGMGFYGTVIPGLNVQQFYISYTYSKCGTFLVTVNWGGGPYLCTIPVTIVGCPGVDDAPTACERSFSPSPGDYILSFWVKEDLASLANISTYSSGIDLSITSTYFGTVNTSVYANGAFNSQNKIIDGWQKVEQKITIPVTATDLNITLTNNAGTGIDCYFDDIRFQPFNSSFKSYVYDPVTLRLSAELDERNYATFYEYDEEGVLIRVKKETERGIKTIKESRTSVSK